jgi:hypothetical protein
MPLKNVALVGVNLLHVAPKDVTFIVLRAAYMYAWNDCGSTA